MSKNKYEFGEDMELDSLRTDVNFSKAIVNNSKLKEKSKFNDKISKRK